MAAPVGEYGIQAGALPELESRLMRAESQIARLEAEIASMRQGGTASAACQEAASNGEVSMQLRHLEASVAAEAQAREALGRDLHGALAELIQQVEAGLATNYDSVKAQSEGLEASVQSLLARVDETVNRGSLEITEVALQSILRRVDESLFQNIAKHLREEDTDGVKDENVKPRPSTGSSATATPGASATNSVGLAAVAAAAMPAAAATTVAAGGVSGGRVTAATSGQVAPNSPGVLLRPSVPSRSQQGVPVISAPPPRASVPLTTASGRERSPHQTSVVTAGGVYQSMQTTPRMPTRPQRSQEQLAPAAPGTLSPRMGLEFGRVVSSGDPAAQIGNAVAKVLGGRGELFDGRVVAPTQDGVGNRLATSPGPSTVVADQQLSMLAQNAVKGSPAWETRAWSGRNGVSSIAAGRPPPTVQGAVSSGPINVASSQVHWVHQGSPAVMSPRSPRPTGVANHVGVSMPPRQQQGASSLPVLRAG
eukprot:TRINITY_DN123319_c0_g1_i1.p1 TRINITY_DN123319_c0_g1~~TRINITY_DN123319_c0_g1_i1.p1  ORF type:complete len:516 (+),score=104.36 TRINITY_DN123319_c0_g1_i1:106-1548(+)